MSGFFTHLDAEGNARMVDVGEKPATPRDAVARGEIVMRPDVIALLKAGGVPKGDVLATARIAGILAAKRADELIPLCHSLALDAVSVDFEIGSDRIGIRSVASCTGKTGVEMEALTAVSVAALTIYDMCKALDKTMTIGAIRLERKSGGRSGLYERKAP